ncbi:MAG: Hpt domain-containing protein [Henriciella sp.]|nr:Hpt domain-containing protein [Henriciella sp.]
MEIDIDHLMSMTGGDADLADEVLDIFRNQAETWGRMLDPAASQLEWADAAHALKGAALSIGAHEFAEECSQVEQKGRGEAPVSRVEAATLLSSLKDGLVQAIEACAKASYHLSKPGLRRSNDSNS